MFLVTNNKSDVSVEELVYLGTHSDRLCKRATSYDTAAGPGEIPLCKTDTCVICCVCNCFFMCKYKQKLVSGNVMILDTHVVPVYSIIRNIEFLLRFHSFRPLWLLIVLYSVMRSYFMDQISSNSAIKYNIQESRCEKNASWLCFTTNLVVIDFNINYNPVLFSFSFPRKHHYIRRWSTLRIRW